MFSISEWQNYLVEVAARSYSVTSRELKSKVHIIWSSSDQEQDASVLPQAIYPFIVSSF